MISNKHKIILILLAALFISACEENKFSPFDLNLQPPYLKELRLGKYTIDTDTIRNNNQFSIYDTITILNDIEILAFDPDGFNDIKEIKFNIVQDKDNKLIQVSYLYPMIQIPTGTESYDVKFQGVIKFEITRQIVGKFRVNVIGYDISGNHSNLLSTSFSIIRSGKPPVLSDLRAPDTLLLPSFGSKIINLSVRCTDENNDIKEVYFKSLDSSDPNRKFYLYDSGNLALHGDSLANDGIFSIRIELPYNMTPKPYRFEFEAKDFTELLSNKILHTINVIKQ